MRAIRVGTRKIKGAYGVWGPKELTSSGSAYAGTGPKEETVHALGCQRMGDKVYPTPIAYQTDGIVEKVLLCLMVALYSPVSVDFALRRLQKEED